MTKGIATVKRIVGDGEMIIFNVNLKGYADDEFAVTFTPWGLPEKRILGLEHLSKYKKGDEFSVEVDIIPPRTSTKTHLVITAFYGSTLKSQRRPDPRDDPRNTHRSRKPNDLPVDPKRAGAGYVE